MTEIIEGVDVGLIAETTTECPFDHTNEKPPSVNNEFIGDADILADNMKSPISTVLYDKLIPHDLVSILSPNEQPSHDCSKARPESEWPIVIPKDESAEAAAHPYRYPVTCAAHHLIPAQASLRRVSRLHVFMIKKGEPEKVRIGKSETTLPGGLVYSDVGYGVNGSENGMFLPGNYAVSKLVMEDPYWTREASVYKDVDWEEGEYPDNENTAKSVPITSPKLTGKRHEISKYNRKWLYVKQAVKKCNGQFHDSHEDYNDWVLSVLLKIAEQYENRATEIFNRTSSCEDCKKRFEEFEKQGIPTPFALLGRLNNVSKNLSGFLTGQKWALPMFTSKWGLAYIQQKKLNNPDAD